MINFNIFIACTIKLNDNNICDATGCDSFVINEAATACAYCNSTSCDANKFCD